MPNDSTMGMLCAILMNGLRLRFAQLHVCLVVDSQTL